MGKNSREAVDVPRVGDLGLLICSGGRSWGTCACWFLRGLSPSPSRKAVKGQAPIPPAAAARLAF